MSDNKESYNLKGMINYVGDRNKIVNEENEADRIVIDFLQLLHKDYMGIEKLDDDTKQDIIELYNCVKESIDLEEENKQNKKQIKSYIKNFDKTTYIRDEKIKRKRLKPETNH